MPTPHVATVSERLEPRRLLAGQAGLTATYFAGPRLTGPSVTGVDATLNHYWNGGSPAEALDDRIAEAGGFSARWEGQIEADHSETDEAEATE